MSNAEQELRKSASAIIAKQLGVKFALKKSAIWLILELQNFYTVVQNCRLINWNNFKGRTKKYIMQKIEIKRETDR